MNPLPNSDSKVSGALAGIEHSSSMAAAGREPSGSKPEDDATARIRWLCHLLETGPHPFAVTDLQQRLVQVNQAFCDLVGYSRQELEGMSTLELTAPESVELTRRYHAEVLASGKNERVVKNYRRKDGSLVPVELMVGAFRDDSGEPIGLYGFISDISERVKAEEVVRESEQRYRELYDEAPIGYYQIDRDGRIKNINKTACELLGYEPKELLGQSLLEMVAHAQRDAVVVSLRAKFEDANRQCLLTPLAAYEEVLLTRDGCELPVEIQEREHRDQDGRIVGLRCVLKDISKRKETEAALVESERRARAIFDGIHDAVIVHDQRGRILDANPAACWQFGYAREELLGMTTSQLDAPDFGSGFLEELKCQYQEDKLVCEGLHRTKSGRKIPVEVTTSRVQFGNQVAVLAILRDITERRALERTQLEFATAQMRNAEEMEIKNRALSESAMLYRQLAEGSLDGIVVADGDGRITLFNPAAEKIFGYEAREVIGQPLERLIGGVLPAPQECSSSPAVCRLGRSPIVGRTVELSGRKKDGTEFPLEISLSAVELSGRPQYIGSIRDQTERQRMEAMLARTDKLASIGLLSAGVAHELNNPLAYVMNNLVVLQREVSGLLEMVQRYEASRPALETADPALLRSIDELAEEIDWSYIRDNLEPMVERTRTGVKRVASIVEKMRGLARTSTPQWESAPLSELVDSVLEMMQGRLKQQQIQVEVQVDEVTQLQCVPDQIRQVLLNLMINALQAIESAGRQDGGKITVEGRLSGPWVAISVRDNGTGISPEHRQRLFDPFFTTKPVGEGTGLGLSISHGIISGHGGRIELESRLGEGSCFRLLLPRQPQPSPQAPTNLPLTSPAPA